ncbi:MAG TPA: DUF4142 domain-containing protein [Burkholderiaceae bacterium]|nr:DUF4142 domain-containing protein [Burkholderiaceae bacterium]
MKTTSYRMIAIAVAAAFASGAALAQTTAAPGSPAPARSATAPAVPAAPAASREADKGADVARADRKFVTEAAASGMAEVQLSKLAMERAANPQVREFAQRMVEDHTKANQELMQIASAKGLELPTELQRGDRRTLDKLTKAEGADFDRQFIDWQVDEHQSAIKQFEREAKDGKDPQLQQFAQKHLPALKEHLQMAKQLDSQLQAARKSAGDQARGARADGASAPVGGTAQPRGPAGAAAAPGAPAAPGAGAPASGSR